MISQIPTADNRLLLTTATPRPRPVLCALFSRLSRRQRVALRWAPPINSSSTTSATAQATGRAGTGVRSATIENRLAAALGFAGPVLRRAGRDVHRHGAGGLGRDRRGVGRVVPLRL